MLTKKFEKSTCRLNYYKMFGNCSFEEFHHKNSIPYEPTEEENEELSRAFTLLDIDGDGVVEFSELGPALIKWGRLPFDDELVKLIPFLRSTGIEESQGMNFNGFKTYIGNQLYNTSDEEELRNCFKIFDKSPPTGKINVKKLRYYLKTKEMMLTDDEIDYLFKEEDYWMLDEDYMFDYELLISKILGKHTIKSNFLRC